MTDKYRQEFYDKYLSTHFLRANKNNAGNSILFPHYDYNFSGFLPEDKNVSILEIGFGMGTFADYLIKKGYLNYSGIDIGKEAVDFVRDNITKNVQMIDDPLTFLKSSANTFDLIVMFDVIEHIRKDLQSEYLKAIRLSLKPGGIFLLKTENMSGLTGLYQSRMDYTHEYNFVETSLMQILKVNGFINIIITAERWKIRKLKSIIRWLAQKIWHYILKAIYTIERPGCVNPTIFSKNLIAVCRKES
ncbi:MAG: class I SAM-dependent methyltransferase [bacterium]|nr:class I SAM-dependent methyltransferase [bacterium]